MKTALILVDLQNDYFPGGKMELVGADDAVRNAALLLAAFRDRAQTVIHVQHVEPGSDAPFFVAGTSGAEIHREVRPRSGEPVIRKRHPNGFHGTGLLDALHTANVQRTVICGATSHLCIDATSRAAADLGFACVVAHDACATTALHFAGRTIPAEEVHGAFMAALAAAYATVVPTGEAISLIG